MASPSRSNPGSPPEKPARRKREAPPASLRFACTAELERKIATVLGRMEQAKDPVQHRDALADLVVALTGRGLDAYFLEPLEQAQAGFVTRQSAALGLAGARQVMGSVIRGIIGRMDGPELLSVCGSVRGFMA